MPRLFEKDGRHQTKGLNRFPPFRAMSGLLDGLTFGLLDFGGKRTGKETKIGVVNYKRGIMGASFGNFMRGAVIGALVLGALALTGGLAAVPLLGGLGVAGGALAIGAANATLGVARHGVEAGINVISAPFVLTAKLFRGVKNMLGFGGEKLAAGMERSAAAGPGARGEPGIMGKVIGAAAAAIATKMGFDSFADLIADKIGNVFGGKGSNSTNRSAAGQPDQSNSGQQGAGNQAPAGQNANATGKPAIPRELADKVVTNEHGEEVLRLSREDLANPQIRDAVKNYGNAMKKHSDQLAKGSLDDKREAASMERKAARLEGTPPKRDSNTGTYEVSAEHLMNGDVVQAMASDGKAAEKANTKAHKEEAKAVDKELKDARDANRGHNGPVVRRIDSDQVFDNAPASPQQAAPTATAQPEVKVDATFEGIVDNFKNGPEAKDPTIKDNQDGLNGQSASQPPAPKQLSNEDVANLSGPERAAYFKSLAAQGTQEPKAGAKVVDSSTVQAAASAAERTHGAPTQGGGAPSGARVSASAEHIQQQQEAARQRAG